MRRFEFVEGTSSKFWEVWCEGAVLHTRYGKLGASGQTTLKTLATDAAAASAEAALIRQKVGKGYVEQGAAVAKAKTAVKLTPFLSRIKDDAKLRGLLGDAGFAPEEDDLVAWAELEADQHREKQFMLGGEYSRTRCPLDFLADFPETEFLQLGTHDGLDLQPVRALKKLTSLKLEGAMKRFELSIVAGMTRLEELDVRGPRVDSLDALAGLPALEKLAVTQGTVSDLGPLAKAKKLTQLFLPDQQLTTLAPLAALTTLTYVQVPGNQIADVSALAKLTALRFLGLKDNQVRDVRPLAGLKALETLYLEGNPLTDTSPLRALKAVRTKDFTVKAAAPVKLDDALKRRLFLLAETKECRAVLERVLTRLRGVTEKKGVVTVEFDGDDHGVVPLTLTAPFTGKLAGAFVRSFVDVVKKVGATVHVDATRPGVDGPCVGLTKRATVMCDCEWDGEDRERFDGFCNAGQNWFVWDAAKQNKRGEPGIVFFSHEGQLDPKRRFPQQDKVAFGTGGFLIRALAYRVFDGDKAFAGCGWG